LTVNSYLKKLSDQIVCLISDEHAANLVWGEENDEMDDPDSRLDEEDDDMNARLVDFSVEKTQNQEEGASLSDGFVV
jgi:hypothetical protein